jgi:secondary thiamine-phosphate synthase enzyme
MTYQETFTLHTRGRGTFEITDQVQGIVRKAGVESGLCHVFQHHTSASLIINENADPAVRHDLETFLSRLVTDGDPAFTHRDEGADDMSAHIRNILTANDLTIPITHGRCNLGTWQGIYLWENRTSPHTRKITVTIHG